MHFCLIILSIILQQTQVNDNSHCLMAVALSALLLPVSGTINCRLIINSSSQTVFGQRFKTFLFCDASLAICRAAVKHLCIFGPDGATKIRPLAEIE